MFAELFLFTSKLFILLFLLVVFLLITVLILSKAKEKAKEKLQIKNLSEYYSNLKNKWLADILPAKEYKKLLKENKAREKAEKKENKKKKSVFVMNFTGDVKASAVSGLSEMITAILQVATPVDEVVLRLESPGGMAHAYGLAAAELMRFRARNIRLIIAIDKVAASGGYLMACVADKIIAAPFAIIGSIGVIVQLPNFNRWLKDKNVDFEQHSVGEYKRTISIFGENTESGRQKLKEEMEEVHHLFKNTIKEFRSEVDLAKVATGEHWHGPEALNLNLIDEIKTSEELLSGLNQEATLYEVSYAAPKSLVSKLLGQAQEKMAMLF